MCDTLTCLTEACCEPYKLLWLIHIPLVEHFGTGLEHLQDNGLKEPP